MTRAIALALLTLLLIFQGVSLRALPMREAPSLADPLAGAHLCSGALYVSDLTAKDEADPAAGWHLSCLDCCLGPVALPQTPQAPRRHARLARLRLRPAARRAASRPAPASCARDPPALS